MVLNDEQRQSVLKNMRLVHYIVRKLSIPDVDYDDLVSQGIIGLEKAAITFDNSKEIKFATYATKCIKNEIFMHLRKQKKHANEISYEDPVTSDDKGNVLTWLDKMPDTTINLEEKIVEMDTASHVINIILNLLKPRERLIVLYKISGLDQESIAQMLHISQSYISRLESKLLKKVRQHWENETKFEEVFSMSIAGNSYKITFASKDIRCFNKIFATLLQNVTSTEELPDFKVSCNKERIMVQIPAHPEAFRFVAQIIQEMDDWSMAYVSDKVDSITEVKEDKSEEKTIHEDIHASIHGEENDAIEIGANEETKLFVTDGKEMETVGREDTVITDSNSIISETSNQTISNDSFKLNENVPKKRRDKCKKIREYILTLESFTVNDIKKKFPELSGGDIGNALHLAKNKGFISPVANKKGYYTVNKKKN